MVELELELRPISCKSHSECVCGPDAGRAQRLTESAVVRSYPHLPPGRDKGSAGQQMPSGVRSYHACKEGDFYSVPEEAPVVL